MRFALALIFIILFQIPLKAQVFPSELWHEGKLVLVSEDSLPGKIKYDLPKGIVQVDNGAKVYTYSAKNIFYFEIYDITSEHYREFYVLPYGVASSYKIPVIFEVLVEGNISLLSQEYVGLKNIQNPYSYGNYSKEVLIYDYYFLDKNGNITKYTQKKKDLMNALISRRNQVTEYMKSNRLHHDKRNDLIRIIAFYNALL
jgi:hypothetical protein